MSKNIREKLKNILTIAGWIVIVFAIIALVMFILKSGVLR